MNCFSVLFVLVSFAIYVVVDNKELPSFVKKCKRNDPALSECMKTAILDFRQHLDKGVKELKLPSMNPYVVPKATIETPWANGTLTNVMLYKAHEYLIEYCDFNLDEGTIRLNVTNPFMELKSHYELDGKILQFTLHGEGEMEGYVNNSKSAILLQGKKIQKKGKEYLQWESIDYKLRGQPNAYMYFHDLFRNNPEITKSVNQVIQENQDQLFKDVYPLVEKIISSIDLSVFKAVFDNYSLDELFE